jgi:hypothetical protein
MMNCLDIYMKFCTVPGCKNSSSVNFLVPNLLLKDIIWNRDRITGLESVSGVVISFLLVAMAAFVISESRAGKKL